ncbi:MAG: hypothetical protein ABI707_14025 [Ferruginibacter sp.]
MAKKKNNPKKEIPEKSTLIKMAGKVGELAGKIVGQKDHLAEMAGNTIESVKAAVSNFTTNEKPAAKAPLKITKKAAPKKERSSVKKVSKTAQVKKTPPLKKAIKKTIKKVRSK